MLELCSRSEKIKLLCFSLFICFNFLITLIVALSLAGCIQRCGGLHYCLCGLQTFIFALPFPRGYCRRCAKPPVSSSHFSRSYHFYSCSGSVPQPSNSQSNLYPSSHICFVHCTTTSSAIFILVVHPVMINSFLSPAETPCPTV